MDFLCDCGGFAPKRFMNIVLKKGVQIFNFSVSF